MYFANLFRASSLIQLGNSKEKIVLGQIFKVLNNDLYIDFGLKFHCICSKPAFNNRKYIKGAIVYLKIKDLQISTKFLGNDTDTTILETDGTLVGIIKNNHETRHMLNNNSIDYCN